MKILKLLFGLMLATSIVNATPINTLEKMHVYLVKEVKLNKVNFHKSDKVVLQIVNKVVLPFVAKKQMAQSVVGRRHWQAASNSQRNKFIRYFTKMVANTYAGAIKNYDNTRVVFYPADYANSAQVVNVRSLLDPANGPNIKVVYQLLKVKNSWKIIDFSVDGVSLINSYRAQFASVLAAGGLAELNAKLAQRNNS